MKRLQMLFALGLFAAASACTSAGSDDVSAGGGSTPPPIQDQPQPAPVVETPLTTSESSSLLSQGTFGPSMQDIAALENASASAWVAAQFDEPMSLHLPNVLAVLPNGGFRNANGEYVPGIAADSFVDTAIRGDDQLRQRMAYALSQILVVSGAPGSSIHFEPHVQAAYMDILVRNAFGNYRDVLEEVTYSPAMASYLTYFRNRKSK